MELPVSTMPSEFHIEDKRLGKIKYALPKIPSNQLFCGWAGSGKTSIIYSMLSKGYVHKGKSIFDEIVVYCSTIDSKEAWEELPCKNIVVLHEFDPEDFRDYLEDLKQHQKERELKKKRRLNVCLVFDDMASEQLVKPLKGKGSPLERLLLTSRHENVSILFATQTFRSRGFTTPTVRNNLNYVYVLSMARNNVEKLWEEYGQNLTKDQFLELYYYIHKEPYKFLLIDNKDKCFRKGFSEIILHFNEDIHKSGIADLLSEKDVDGQKEQLQ